MNVVLNKILLPWVNFLAAAENIPRALAFGTLDALKDIDAALRHSPFQMEYQGVPDMTALQGAMGLTMEIGPASDYAVNWLSTNQQLRSLATAPAFWFTGAGGVGGGIPPAQQAVQTLAPELATSLPAAPPSAGSLLLENSSRGNDFMEAVRENFSLPKNTITMLGQTRSGALRGTIQDVYGGGDRPQAEIKDLLRLFFTGQLQAQDAVAGWTRTAGMTGSSFNIIVGPRNLTISAPLFDAVQASGGFIFRVDPSAMTVEVLVDRANRVWVPFLGGSWGF